MTHWPADYVMCEESLVLPYVSFGRLLSTSKLEIMKSLCHFPKNMKLFTRSSIIQTNSHSLPFLYWNYLPQYISPCASLIVNSTD